MYDQKRKEIRERSVRVVPSGQEKMPTPRDGKCVAILKHRDGRIERREL